MRKKEQVNILLSVKCTRAREEIRALVRRRE
jgi:hypothetical protein